MNRYLCFSMALYLMAWSSPGFSEEVGMIKLPVPAMTGGKPLMQVLKERHSTREYSTRSLSKQMLSNLLWAAAGVNRPESGKRTAPSARDWREIEIYVALQDGVYRYDANTHALKMVIKEDLRAATGVQDFVAHAPVNLVYVANLKRMEGAETEQKHFYSATDTGFIAQNVYLFCASEGLATVVRGSVERDALAKKLGLAKHQRIILAQTVGYPVE